MLKPKKRETPKNPRKDAFEQDKKDYTFVDSKGKWILSYLSPDMIQQGKTRYYLYIQLEESPMKYVENQYSTIIWDDATKKNLGSMIKYATGYKPTPRTLNKIYTQVQEWISLRKEEDIYYATQDKKKAEKGLNDLVDRAIERFEKGEEFTGAYGRKLEEWQRYLTEDEQNQLFEHQKAINGHAHYDYDHRPGGFLNNFYTKLTEKLSQVRAKQKLRQIKARRIRLDELFETNPDFRRLVSHFKRAMQANPDNVIKEIVNQLYGYSKDFEEYRIKLNKFEYEHMKKYGLDSYLDYRDILRYTNDDFLPPTQPLFFRKEGEIYYGDKVINGTRALEVEKVGRHYVYFKYGLRAPKSKITLHSKVDYLQEPKSEEDFISNKFRHLHNIGSFVNSYNLYVEQAVRGWVSSDKSKGPNNYHQIVQKWEENAANEIARKAMQRIKDHIRIVWLERLSEEPSIQQERFREELKELKGKVTPCKGIDSHVVDDKAPERLETSNIIIFPVKSKSEQFLDRLSSEQKLKLFSMYKLGLDVINPTFITGESSVDQTFRLIAEDLYHENVCSKGGIHNVFLQDKRKEGTCSSPSKR